MSELATYSTCTFGRAHAHAIVSRTRNHSFGACRLAPFISVLFITAEIAHTRNENESRFRHPSTEYLIQHFFLYIRVSLISISSTLVRMFGRRTFIYLCMRSVG